MRDLRNVDATGKNKSKEYGFVTFTSHEDALKALRSINNNPNIFSKHRVRSYKFISIIFIYGYFMHLYKNFYKWHYRDL